MQSRLRQHAVSAALTTAAGIALLVICLRRHEELAAAFTDVPLWALVGAVVLHLATLAARSEAWVLALRSAAATAAPDLTRTSVHAANAGAFVAGAVVAQAALPVRVALLRRLTKGRCPGVGMTAFADLPIAALEVLGVTLLLALAALVVPGVPGWLAPAGLVVAVAGVYAVRVAPVRFAHRPATAGLCVLGDRTRRGPLAALVTAITVLGVVRAWLLLVAFELPHDPGHVALLFVSLGAFGLLPIGPTASPAGALAAVGAEQVAAATALGLAISGTTIVAVLAYATVASVRRATAGTPGLGAPASRKRVEPHAGVLASVVPFFVERHEPGGLSAQMSGPEGTNLGLPSERALWERVHDGDLAAREQLVHRYLPLARQLAARYAGRGRPLEDLIQVANLGLVKAVDRYQLDRGAAFSSYAVPTIVGELRRHFRDVGWAVHVPRSVQERVLKIGRATERLSADTGRTPTVAELALATQETPEDVVEALSAGHAYEADSLDEPSAAGDGESASRGDRMGEDDPGFERVEDWQAIAPAIDELSDRDRIVLRLRFVEDLTQSQIADQVGVSQMQVSRILRRCLSTISEHARRGLDGPNDKPKRAIAG